MPLLDGVRVVLTLVAECTLDADLRETIAESEEVVLPNGIFFGTSDNPGSASEKSLGFPGCGVCGGAVRWRGGICSRTGERRSVVSLSASEFRALEAALTEIGEGRE
jgi:hypothetical protein